MNKQHSVIVSNIKITKPTENITGLSSYEEVVKKAKGVFSAMSENKLISTITEDIYKGKLSSVELNNINKMTKVERVETAYRSLTFTLELTQQGFREASNQSKVMSAFMGSRLNMNATSSSLKYAWVTSALGTVEDEGYSIGDSLSNHYKEQGLFIYIQRLSSFEAEVRDGNVISSPKRAGKGGDILTKDGKLIFMHTTLVLQEVNEDVATYDEMYEILSQEEIENTAEFQHDKGQEISADVAGEEIRNSDGTFDSEFQNFLNEKYLETYGMQTEIA